MMRNSKKRATANVPKRPLWKCPKCGARFVTKNMWHSCGKYDLAALFARSEPRVLNLFRKFARLVRTCGPAKMIQQKTRVVFMTRVRFAGVYPRKNHFVASFALARRLKSPRITRIEEYAPHFIGHSLEIHSQEDLNDELHDWISESFSVGSQEYNRR